MEVGWYAAASCQRAQAFVISSEASRAHGPL